MQIPENLIQDSFFSSPLTLAAHMVTNNIRLACKHRRRNSNDLVEQIILIQGKAEKLEHYKAYLILS